MKILLTVSVLIYSLLFFALPWLISTVGSLVAGRAL